MNKIEIMFQTLAKRNQKAFVPYIMAGDGGLHTLKDKILFLEKCGATAIELGIPFSDPAADGPTIQQAGIRALQSGTTLQGVLNTVASFRNEVAIPIIVMTYMNPIFVLGIEKFAEAAQQAGVDGCIIPDLPLEEEQLIVPTLENVGIEFIRLVTLTSSEERISEISQRGNGFLYAVTVKGITGARSEFGDNLANYFSKIKEVSRLPVLAGFGISTPEQAKEMAKLCDGVIVGSRIIELFQENDLEGIEQLIQAVIENQTRVNRFV